MLERLALVDARVALLSEALHRVANARDIELWLAMREQEAMGDRSPAASVGPWLGMEPAAARQQRRRVELRLQALVRDDPHFAGLAEVFEPFAAAA